MNEDLIKSAIRIIIALPFVTALAYYLIKYGLARRPFYTRGRRMRLLEQVPVGPKTFVSLLEVGGEYIILAHSENGFQVLREMPHLPEPIAGEVLSPPGLKRILALHPGKRDLSRQ